MRNVLRSIASPLLTRNERVPISSCVHYCGFRYGRGEFNPYENYVVALSQGEPLQDVRHRFEEFLRYYRPHNLGEALGVSLTRDYPMWEFPWYPQSTQLSSKGAWMESPVDVVDIVTHFSSAGILRHRIDEEFSWLENAYISIRKVGYHPSRFAGHIRALKLVNEQGHARYLIQDGNHRLSALVALGNTEVVVSHNIRMTIRSNDVSRWPQVAAGYYSRKDAEDVFGAYFRGNSSPKTTDMAAPIIVRAVKDSSQ